MLVQIWTDGATLGHNKMGKTKEVGLGVYCQSPPISIAERVPGLSSNEAEFLALIRGMNEAIKLNLKKVHFFLDSKIVVNRASVWITKDGVPSRRPKGKFRNPRMDKFQDQVLMLRSCFDEVHFYWIPREQNEIADGLSKIALHKLIYPRPSLDKS